MKKKNIYKKIAGVMAILLIVMTLVSSGFIFYMNILPTKYLIGLLVFLVVVIGSIVFFMVRLKTNKNTKTWLDLLSLLIITTMIIGIGYGLNTLGFLDKISNTNYKIETYYVVVLKDSEYKKINDLKNKKMGYIKDINYTATSLSELKKVIPVDAVLYTDLSVMATELLDKTLPTIVLESSYHTILTENNLSYKTNTKIIYTIKVKVKAESISKKTDVTNSPFNIYISGADSYGTIDAAGRSDVNMIMSVNPNTNKILLTTIPRDYYVELNGTTGYKDKLTHAGIYGIDMSVRTIEDLLGIDINYYIKINFTSLIESIDVIGGVEVYSKYKFTATEGVPYKFTKGYNYLNGLKALSFSRERHSFINGDRTRGENQQAVLEAIIKKVSSSLIVTKYNNILKTLTGSFKTNMSSSDILKLVRLQIDKNPTWTVTAISLDGTDGSEYTYTFGKELLYVMIPTQSTIDAAKVAISDIFISNVKNN